jgi:hypothetical protein
VDTNTNHKNRGFVMCCFNRRTDVSYNPGDRNAVARLSRVTRVVAKRLVVEASAAWWGYAGLFVGVQ